jgi:hypothetical protein
LHVLGTPPAFTLSQDQTLHHEKSLSLVGPPRGGLQGIEVHAVWLAARQLPAGSLCFKAVSGLPTSRPCTHGGRLVHTSSRSSTLVLARFSTDQLGVTRRAHAGRQVATRHPPPGGRSSRRGPAAATSRRPCLPRGSDPPPASRRARPVPPVAPIAHDNLLELALLHSALVQVRGARDAKGIKNPEGLSGTSGRRYGTLCVPVRRCLGSSMLPLSRLVDGLTVVNASLAQRTSNYTACPLDKANERAQAGCQPSGVGRLKVRLACVERATTMRTGSLWLVFISTCTRCGGTHTKSPVWASCAWSSWSPE